MQSIWHTIVWGFHPHGQEYWLFTIEQKIEDKQILSCVLDQVNELKAAPQIVSVSRIRNN